MNKNIYIGLIFLLVTNFTNAQQFVNRNAIYNPFVVSFDSTDKILPSLGFWSEGAKGFGSRDNQFHWNIALGGTVQFYRWQKFVIHFTYSHQFTASPYNDISFDPRSGRWQEALEFSYGDSLESFSIGFSHRCKHEIDNFDPGRGTNFDVNQLTKRVTLISGPLINYQKHLYILDNTKLSLAGRAEYVVAGGDYRTPEINIDYSWANTLAELNFNTRIEHNFNQNLGLYTKIWYNLLLFENENTQFNNRAEIGFLLKGKNNSLNAFIAYEKLADDLITPIPAKTEVLFVGLRISSNLYW